MRVFLNSRRGKFNFCRPNEESISTHIEIQGVEPKLFCNITTDYIETDNNPETLADLIREYHKKLLWSSSRENDLKVADFLDANALELSIGNTQESLAQVEASMLVLEKKKAALTNLLKGLLEEKEENSDSN